MDSDSWLNVALAGAFVFFAACSFLFTCVETALTLLGRLYARQMVESNGNGGARRIEEPGRFLTAALIGNTAANFAAALVAGELAVRLVARQPGLTDAARFWTVAASWAAGAALLLLFGEALPRAYAARRAERLPDWLINLMVVYQKFLANPFVTLLTRLTSGSLILLTGRGIEEIPFPNVSGLTLLGEVSDKESDLDEDEREMIQSIFEFSDTVVREVMVPRIQVKALDIDASLADALQVVVEAGHSRIPVYEGTIDNIVGILYAKDLLTFWKGRLDQISLGGAPPDMAAPDYRLREYLRKAYFVPENKPIHELLQEFQRSTTHFAIVVDEYGGTAGVVTIEDVLEEIVGEIQDEYDQEPELLVENPDGTYTADGCVEIEEIEERFGCDFPEEDYETIGGFLFLQLGDVPGPGASLDYQNLRLTVLDADDRRIHKIRIEVLPEEAEKPWEGEDTGGEAE